MTQPPQNPGSDPWGQPSGSSSANSGYDPQDWSQASYEAPAPGYGGAAPAPQYTAAPLPPGGPAPQASQGGGKGKLWALIGCGGCGVLAVLLVIILVIVIALSGLGSTDEDPEPIAVGTSEGEVVHGTSEDPLPMGTTLPVAVDGGTLEVTLGEVTWDATAALQEVSPSLTPAEAGNQYILVTVDYTYHGSGETDPAWDSSISFTAADGQAYVMAPAVTENSILDVATLTDGQSTVWDVAFEIPADAVGTGSFEVFSLDDFEEPSFYVSAV
ncbi:hypothetical protein BF93_03565 [Brachybacterium phenoliresistens]|uniref:DUF4352 domain-containing protein n=1 Tax=Brachybacterium phenoliresistens TaxID=396014 RepID=Z9JQ18_9MICO|nr:hypothetical protein [Brachybacterium phenoliresistens]EWS80485.1 hypothetical protein BF93_03565 [Brachybacterium phenoliresistens]